MIAPTKAVDGGGSLLRDRRGPLYREPGSDGCVCSAAAGLMSCASLLHSFQKGFARWVDASRVDGLGALSLSKRLRRLHRQRAEQTASGAGKRRGIRLVTAAEARAS